MRKLLAIFFTIIMALPGFGQEIPAAYKAYRDRFPEGPALNHQDSLYLMNLPEKTLPASLRSDPLPPVVDNSTLPYLRPVFEQVGPSCGQAAMVGYNFTYEMAYLRDQSALDPQAQYPTHFTWNFQNGGNGWWGVSYFHSLEILRTVGCMNSYDYGGFYDDGSRWINGYDFYYNGMFNRIKGAYCIKTGTEEGILALKHWLYDHMGEGNHGGVASYYANTPWNAGFLDEGTPEEGKFVVYAWYPIASHAMTIVGYNDSIRWDYNNDGQYTNDIDLNGDGVLDPRDWEIGAVKFVNSHGTGAQNEGFCYMMYKCLSETFEQGGVWNREVHILDIDQDYQPLMTYKITLKHDQRQKVKILAGVSQGVSDNTPAFIMDFPIINYQGDDHYMQGQDTAEYLKSLEFGLDITPLLCQLQPGVPAKFFFMVDETDPLAEGAGEITSFSLVDYTSGQQEIASSLTPMVLENDSRTIISLVYTPDYDHVEVTTSVLPPYSAGEPYNYQLQAAGGTSPYAWEPAFNYLRLQSTGTFPETDEQQVLYTPFADTIMPVALDFDFPYFGEYYDTVYMHADGHLQFDNSQLPWPYMQEPEIHFRSRQIIAPLESHLTVINMDDGDGGWAEITDSCATFRWKLSERSLPSSTTINFAVRIWSNGNIDFIHGTSTLEGMFWLGGISAGNSREWLMSPFSGAEKVLPGSKITFLYRSFPPELSLSPGGTISGTLNDDEEIIDLSFRVTDKHNLTAQKTLQLSSGPYLYFTINGLPDQDVDFGELVSLDLGINNGGQSPMPNAMIELATDDPFIEITDSDCNPGTILPGQTSFFPEAFLFTVSNDIPDQRDIILHATLSTDNDSWHKDVIFRAKAPVLNVKKFVVESENEILDPGETAPFTITLQNSGHADLDGVLATLTPVSPEVQVLGNPVQDFGNISNGMSVSRSYILEANASTPDGIFAALALSVISDAGISMTDTILLRIGKAPVLVIDMDPVHHSGPGIYSMLDKLSVLAGYDHVISNLIDEYQSLFICLGYQNFNHVLTYQEGQKIAGFLDAGGKVYMEGRLTWRDDPETPAQPKFSLTPVSTVGVYDTINGIDGTITQGISLLNEATVPFSFYYLEPVDQAYSILHDNDTYKSCAVANDAGTYKTIGALFEYGTMADISENASMDLMIKYLDFFNIPVDPVGIEEKYAESMQVEVYPNPAGEWVTVGGWQLAVGGRRSAVSSWQSAVGSWQTAISLEIFDLFGRKVISFVNIPSLPHRIDISGLPNGMYLLRMTVENGQSYSVKFLKAVE